MLINYLKAPVALRKTKKKKSLGHIANKKILPTESLWQTQNFAAQSRRQAQNYFKIFNLLASDIIQKVV